MAKKSKKTAARYSELSKAKKKKQQRGKTPDHIQPISVAEATEFDGPEPVERPVARPVAKPAPRVQTEGRRGMPSYEYVRTDLRRIGILAGAMLGILIILSFILG